MTETSKPDLSLLKQADGKAEDLINKLNTPEAIAALKAPPPANAPRLRAKSKPKPLTP